jgi:hypothetical protein
MRRPYLDAGTTKIIIFLMIMTFTTGILLAEITWKSWPPKKFLIRSLVNSVDQIIKTFNPENGRFGSEPWICQDQNVIFPLAAAWVIKDPDNPYYHDPKLLNIIAKGG